MRKRTRVGITLLMVSGLILGGCGNRGQEQPDQGAENQITESQALENQPEEGKQPETGEDKVYKVIFAHHQTTDSPIGMGIDRLAATLNEKSNGRLEVQVYPAEQLGNESSVYEQLCQGSVQMSTFGFGIIGSQSPTALAMEMGYMFEDSDHLQKFLVSDVFSGMVEDTISSSGVHILGAYYNGTRHLTTTHARVEGPEDMKGLKIRVPNSEMILATLGAMGCNPTVMAFSETYMGLQNGTVEGQENPVPSIVSMNFQEVQKYLCKTAHMIQAASICINEEFLKSLPEDLQKLMVEETQAELQAVSQDVLQKEVDQEKILTDAGMKIVETDKEAFQACMTDVIAEYEKVWGEGLYDRIQATK